MKKIYIFVVKEKYGDEDIPVRFNEDEIKEAKKVGNILNYTISWVDTKLWLSSSPRCREAAFYLRSQLGWAGTQLEYQQDYYLDSEPLAKFFIDIKLKKTIRKHNIIIASEDICNKLLEFTVNKINSNIGECYCIDYDEQHDVFQYAGIIK